MLTASRASKATSSALKSSGRNSQPSRLKLSICCCVSFMAVPLAFLWAIDICGIEWGPRGINGLQLPMGSDEKTRARIRQRHGDSSETAPTEEVQRAIDRIVKLLAGERDDLKDIALDLDGGPDFNRGVYE